MDKIIKSTGEVNDVSPANNKHYTLEEMQSIVGGYIESVYINSKNYLVLNEEGMYQCPINEKASNYFKRDLYGDVLICNIKHIK